jgi:2-C-methyl-D-erythritol 2,4-cyclodiphosphate synthase
MSYHTGVALDVHGFSLDADSAEHLRLGLVDFPDLPKLEGHSDGDVVAHAIADALLLAASLPDLGATIGVSDPEYKGATGIKILTHILGLISGQGLQIESVSVQIVAKRPKIAGVLQKIQLALSEVLGVRVGVGATTTDGNIPDLGDGKAIMAVANVLLLDASSN